MQLHITMQNLEKLRGPLLVHDIDQKGFGAYINNKGDVSWFAQAYLGGRRGKQVRTVFGRPPSMPLAEARKQVLVSLGKIAAGEDVSLKRKVV